VKLKNSIEEDAFKCPPIPPSLRGRDGWGDLQPQKTGPMGPRFKIKNNKRLIIHPLIDQAFNDAWIGEG
jgi:hypothetical protein